MNVHDEDMSFAMTSPFSTIVLVAVTAIAVSGCGVNVAFGDDVTERTETRSIAIGELSALRVETANGAVTVTGADADEIEVIAHLRERSSGDAEFTISERDGVLDVAGDCDDGWFSECRVGFEITVPAAMTVDVETDNGRIELRRLSGDVEASTDNGAIEATGLTGDRVSADTDNGRIRLEFDDAPNTVNATTDNGAIRIRVATSAVYDVDTETDNGAIDVDVRTDPEAERRIIAHTDNGAIDISEHRD